MGQSYGGEVRRKLKTYGPRREGGRGRWHKPGSSGRKRLSSHWMRGVKVCLVCGKGHRSNDRHYCEVVNKEVQRLKEKHPKALITVEDMAFITSNLRDDEESGEDETAAKWAHEDDYTSASDLENVATCDLQEIGVTL